MWRRQDEPKAPSAVSEVTPYQQVTPHTAPPGIGAAPAEPIPTSHLTDLLVIKGEITGQEDLLIDGQIHGKICIETGRVVVSPKGRVVAEIEAQEIMVNGQVDGSLCGRERVRIGESGRVTGDVQALRISVEEGAEIHGNVDVRRPQKQSSFRGNRVAEASETDLVRRPKEVSTTQ
jgi:cytoskeletal protein CcmA (bactofilin family)